MPAIRDVIKRVKESKQAEYSQKYMLCTLVPIDSATSCRVANRRNYVWVREYNNPNNTFIAFAPNTQDSINLPVLVTRNKQPPHFKRRVVEVDYSRIDDDGSINDNFEGHGATHEWATGNPGNDVFDTYPRSIYPMALRTTTGVNIYITPGIYRYKGQSWLYMGEMVSLSSYLPSAGTAVRICIYVTPESNDVGVISSAEVTAGMDPAYPLPYYNVIPVGWIKLLSTTTSITEADIDDPRAFISVNEIPSWNDVLHKPEFYTDFDAFHDNVDEEFYALTAKASPNASDIIPIEDSEDNFSKKYIRISSLPGGEAGTDTAAIHDNVAGEINAITEKTEASAADVMLLEDSDAAYVKKRITVANLLRGVAGPDFDLSAYTGLVSWHKAGVDITYASDLVSQWDDQSGNGYDAAQATAGYKPLYIADTKHGYPAIAFDGVDDYLGSSAVPNTGANARTLLLAYAACMSAAGNTYNHMLHYGIADTNRAYGITGRVGSVAGFGNHYWGNSKISVAWGEIGPGIVIVSYDGTDDKMYLNGTLIYTNTIVLNTGNTYGIQIGSRISAPSENGKFWVLEAASWNVALSDSDRNAIFDGLMAKFNI